MRLMFFPGNELAPPELLGEIIDLDNPQQVLANVFLKPNSGVVLKPIRKISKTAQQKLLAFVATIDPKTVRRTNIIDIMSHSTRNKSMC